VSPPFYPDSVSRVCYWRKLPLLFRRVNRIVPIVCFGTRNSAVAYADFAPAIIGPNVRGGRLLASRAPPGGRIVVNLPSVRLADRALPNQRCYVPHLPIGGGLALGDFRDDARLPREALSPRLTGCQGADPGSDRKLFREHAIGRLYRIRYPRGEPYNLRCHTGKSSHGGFRDAAKPQQAANDRANRADADSRVPAGSVRIRCRRRVLVGEGSEHPRRAGR